MISKPSSSTRKPNTDDSNFLVLFQNPTQTVMVLSVMPMLIVPKLLLMENGNASVSQGGLETAKPVSVFNASFPHLLVNIYLPSCRVVMAYIMLKQ